MKKKNRLYKWIANLLICAFLFGSYVMTVSAETGETLETEAVIGESVESTDSFAETVTINDENQLAELFPDAAFRSVVFEAVKGSSGSSVEEVLRNYTGNIDAASKGINSIKGIEYLRNAGTVDFSFNNISDLSFLKRANKDTEEGNLWYEGQGADGRFEQNVTWILDGNPLATIPEYFGGKLVIEQPATHFSVYPGDNGEIQSYVRKKDPIDGIFHVGRVRYDGWENYVKLVSIHDFASTDRLTIDINQLGADNNIQPFSGLIKSGKHIISVGTGKIFVYGTAAELDLGDETIWAVTSGDQSFKYNIQPVFYVYDKVTLKQNTFNGAVQLTKTDEAGKPLAGAVYSLYKEGKEAPIQENLKTGENGTLRVDGLEGGNYYFRETAAPAGYVMSTEPVTFTIASPVSTLGGGLKTISDLKNSEPLTAGENEVFIAGPKDDTYSPDITLSLNDEAYADTVKEVIVTYSKLETITKNENGNYSVTTNENVKRSFSSLAEAQADINNEKTFKLENNRFDTTIVGPVEVNVIYNQSSDLSLAEVSQKNAKEPEEPDSVAVDVEKKWVDKGHAGAHPAITINLLQNGTKINSAVLKNGMTAYRFENLKTVDEKGQPYTYTVEEAPVAGYTSEITGDAKNGFTITNTFEKPNDPGKPSEPGKPDTPKPPQTGDTVNIGGLILLMLVSLGLIAGFCFFKKRRAS